MWQDACNRDPLPADDKPSLRKHDRNMFLEKLIHYKFMSSTKRRQNPLELQELSLAAGKK